MNIQIAYLMFMSLQSMFVILTAIRKLERLLKAKVKWRRIDRSHMPIRNQN